MRKIGIRSISEKRKAQLKAKAPTRRAWINRTTKGAKRKGRKPSETLRIYGPPERRAWIKARPCFACISLSPLVGIFTAGTSENAHTVTGGTGRKADADTIVPLCASHHRRYDQHQPPFDRAAVRDVVKAAAPKYEAAWQAHTLSRTTV